MAGPTSLPQRQTSVSLGQQWDQAVTEIDCLLIQHQTGQTDKSYTGITKDHWKPNSFRTLCANSKCGKKFSLTERYHHCRRCGDLFCDLCTKYNRRLNYLAHPDPNGKLYKVCQVCFDQGPQTIGQCQNLMPYFQWCKDVRKEQRQKVLNGQLTKGHRGRLDFEAECERLKIGFQNSVPTSTVKRTLGDLKSVVTTPTWQKSSHLVFEALSDLCHTCRKEFGVVKTKHHCAVCGVAVCSTCSVKELIVFVPDEHEDKKNPDVKLAIIKIVGCPDKEPDICMYLRVCQSCQTRVKEKQVAEYYQTMVRDPSEIDTMVELVNIRDQLARVQEKIETYLPHYQELIEALEIEPGAARSLPQTKSNTQTLAKAQGDLSDHFTRFVMTLQELKRHRPTTKAQSTVLRNMTKSNCDYYQENMFQFRELKRKLEAVTPAEVLQCIQQIVDKNAINSLYLSVKQLALESLHLCTKYELGEVLPEELSQLEEVAQQDLRTSLGKCGEIWEEHEICVNQLLQQQLKGHRLIRPSRRMTKEYGSRHIQAILLERSDLLLQQMDLQLGAKCADRSFRATKSKLGEVHNAIKTIDFEGVAKEQNGWVLVS